MTLKVSELRVAFDGVEVVHGVSFSVAAGECVALVGESGSGKSVTARALLGLSGGTVSGRIELDGAELPRGERALRRIRGSRIGYVPQDALVSLDPLRPIAREIGDALRLHTSLSAAERSARVIEVLASVGMPEPAARAAMRSGELSGGLRQRALLAAALATDPPLLLADEPTTALDVTVQARILELFAAQKAAGRALLLISHDLAVVAGLADRILVLADGRVVEEGATREVLTAPHSPEARALVAAVPTGKPRGVRLSAAPASAPAPAASAASAPAAPTSAPSASSAPAAPVSPSGNTGSGGKCIPVHADDSAFPAAHPAFPARTTPARTTPVLTAIGLTKRFGARVAVDDVHFELHRGETLGLVGESGSGKSTVARLVLGLTAADAGAVTLFGDPWSALPERERRPRRRRIGAIYQDSFSSFDPRWSVGRILRDAGAADAAALLGQVGLEPEVLRRAPRTLSGGQRQRVSIARALATEPEVLICDEPVSALDVSVQAQVLDLLDELQRERGLAMLFISHDLAVVQHMADRIAVMRAGRIVETAPTEALLAAPADEYTRRLLADSPHL